MCKLWTIPQDLDDNVSMMLSAEHKEKNQYKYDLIKLTFRDKNRGQNAKSIQLLSMPGEDGRRKPGRWTTDLRGPIVLLSLGTKVIKD